MPKLSGGRCFCSPVEWRAKATAGGLKVPPYFRKRRLPGEGWLPPPPLPSQFFPSTTFFLNFVTNNSRARFAPPSPSPRRYSSAVQVDAANKAMKCWSRVIDVSSALATVRPVCTPFVCQDKPRPLVSRRLGSSLAVRLVDWRVRWPWGLGELMVERRERRRWLAPNRS